MGAENLCHQAIFMNHATRAVTPLDPEMENSSRKSGMRMRGAIPYTAVYFTLRTRIPLSAIIRSNFASVMRLSSGP